MRTERFDLNRDGSARLMVDIYDEKPAVGKAPALVYVPGGAFMMCVETDRGEIASRLVERGFRVSCTYVCIIYASEKRRIASWQRKRRKD